VGRGLAATCCRIAEWGGEGGPESVGAWAEVEVRAVEAACMGASNRDITGEGSVASGGRRFLWPVVILGSCGVECMLSARWPFPRGNTPEQWFRCCCAALDWARSALNESGEHMEPSGLKASGKHIASGRRAAAPDGNGVDARDAARSLELDRDVVLRGSAQELFCIKGLGVPLAEIARVAGVGVATLYRRYRDKDILILDVYREPIHEQVRLAVAANQCPDPWEGIGYFLGKTSERLLADRGMRELILGGYLGSAGWARGSTSGELLAALDAMDMQMAQQLRALVERAKEAGAVREDFRHSDLMLMTAMIHSAVPHGGAPGGAESCQRALVLLTEGIRPPSGG
jgi:AcrR family transcriptional regulator